MAAAAVVDQYSFKSSRKKPVCFSTLRLRFGNATNVPEGNKRLFLRGFDFAGGRRRLVLKRVVAWRLELDGEQPEFFVLVPEDRYGGRWLHLAKPGKLYEPTARTVVMTAQVLHFLRRNPDGPETDLWIHLRQAFWYLDNSPVAFVFSFGGKGQPSEHDFVNQSSISLMRQFAVMDPVLANSEAAIGTLPDWLGELHSLRHLELSMDDLKQFPEAIQHLTSLEYLNLMSGPALTVLLEWIGQLSALHQLYIQDSPALQYLPQSIQRLTALEDLFICGCPGLAERYKREAGLDWHLVNHISKVTIF